MGFSKPKEETSLAGARYGKIWWFGVVLFCLYPGVSTWSNDPPPAKGEQPVAMVAGQPIYEGDLQPLIQSQLYPLRRQEYELKTKALDQLIEQKLLEAEASKQGIPAAKLLEEIQAKVTEPTDPEVEAFYLAQKDRIDRPLESVREPLRQGLKQARLDQARQAYLDDLRDKADVSVYLRPPKVEVAYDPARVRGDSKAPVTIVEFSDFQCPFCKKVHPVMKELLTKYAGRVKLAYRDFPLRQIHAQAQIAAEASRCAEEQGRFWEYHDRLFENQGKLDQTALVEYAAGGGLDRPQFESCLASGKFRPQIEQDYQEGMRLGVQGTPAFFINGVLVSGAQPADVFEKAIEAELRAGENPAPPRETTP